MAFPNNFPASLGFGGAKKALKIAQGTKLRENPAKKSWKGTQIPLKMQKMDFYAVRAYFKEIFALRGVKKLENTKELEKLVQGSSEKA